MATARAVELKIDDGAGQIVTDRRHHDQRLPARGLARLEADTGRLAELEQRRLQLGMVCAFLQPDGFWARRWRGPQGRLDFLAVLVAKPASPRLLAPETGSNPLRRDRKGAEGRLVVEQAIDRFHHGVLHVDADQVGEREGADTEAGRTGENAVNVRGARQCLRSTGVAPPARRHGPHD